MFWASPRKGALAPDINLSGTTGVPNESNAYQTDPTNATAGWVFNTNGNMQRWTGNPASLAAWEPATDEWSDPSKTGIGSEYWIRFTSYSGTSPTGGSSLNVWHALSTERSVLWERTVIGFITGIAKVEISSDSSGTPIVATGYYEGRAEVETGA